ncbi:MAG: cation:proton antiporter [Chryseolinea sp.]
MITQNVYYDILITCGVVILSYSFGWISKITKVPTVLLLIILGIGFQFLLRSLNLDVSPRLMDILELLGIVGLIMIVLEAALDLKLTKEKKSLVLKAFFVALLALAGSCAAIAVILIHLLHFDFYIALVYAIPLSVMSSAIIIPSVKQLPEQKKEFMIYESTFSDILGIMLFYFVIDANENATATSTIIEVTANVVITIILSVILSYLLVLIFQRIRDNARLFLLISVLIMLYSIGKIFHLSSLIVILIFGLTLSNYQLFFSGKLKRFIDGNFLEGTKKEFHLVTLESAFVVRTFFFVVFGITLDLQSLFNLETAIISLSIVAALYTVRFVFLRFFLKDILTELLIAPRGLITILLFFGIPAKYFHDSFSSGILLYTILFTGIIMTVGLMLHKDEPANVNDLSFESLADLDSELSRKQPLPHQPENP